MQNIAPHVLRSVLEHQKENPEVLCIDVRNPDEYAEGHIAGVINIPLPELATHRDEFATKKEIYVHCKSGMRSQKACGEIDAMGIPTKTFNVEGGILAWQHEGLPIVE